MAWAIDGNRHEGICKKEENECIVMEKRYKMKLKAFIVGTLFVLFVFLLYKREVHIIELDNDGVISH